MIADTHGRLPTFLMEGIVGADEIWHLGDVCEEGTWQAVEQVGPPALVVRGNQDVNSAWPMS